jgi:hypothetical protein
MHHIYCNYQTFTVLAREDLPAEKSLIYPEFRSLLDSRTHMVYAYATASPLALHKSNRYSGFCRVGLFLFTQALVLQCFPVEAIQVEHRLSHIRCTPQC